MPSVPLQKWCTISPLHTHTHAHTPNSVPSYWCCPWASMMISQEESLSLSCSILFPFSLLSPTLLPLLQSISKSETGHQSVPQRYIPQPWPATVPSGMEYFDGTKAYPPSQQLEQVLMNSPTNDMSNWSEGSSPQKGVFYHTQMRNLDSASTAEPTVKNQNLLFYMIFPDLSFLIQ